MCGIAGVISKQSRGGDPLAALFVMKRAIDHRGPNEHGSYAFGGNAFLNVRLSIVDIGNGRQPIFTDDGSKGIVYNGEVYNYVELRSELERKGYSFRTNTDTEVVLKLFEEHGVEAFRKLNGMFALCIWDEKTGSITIARDRFGTKPLYIYEDRERLIFASEMKAILALPNLDLSLDPHGIEDYLTYRYVQAPLTIYRRIRRLEAGTCLELSGGRAIVRRYWEPQYADSHPLVSVEEVKDELEAKLRRAVESQLMGEVPIAVLLSGGIDSSSIAYFVHELGANLLTYSIGFPDLNEFQYSRIIAERLGLKHLEITTTPAELMRDLDEIVGALDEPLADPACFPLYHLARELRKSVTVVLSGEGGDELFAGYPQYSATLDEYSAAGEMERFEGFFRRSYYFEDGPRYLSDTRTAMRSLRNRKYFLGESLLNGMLSYDMRTWMPENLMMKADKIMMRHSLEGRFPFLDNDLFDFAAKLPESFKLREGRSKWLLKEMIATKLPREIIERPKMGFSVPIPDMLTTLRDKVMDSMETGLRSELGSVLDARIVRSLFEGFYSDPGWGTALRTWSYFVLFHWFTSARPGYSSLFGEISGREAHVSAPSS